MEMANVTQSFTVSTEVPLVTGPNEIYQALSGSPFHGVSFPDSEIRQVGIRCENLLYLLLQVANCGRINQIGIKNLMLALEIAVQRTVEEGGLNFLVLAYALRGGHNRCHNVY